MAAQTALIAQNADGGTVVITFDDVTLLISQVAWNNPTGTWAFTFQRNGGGATISRTLTPGSTGSVNIPAHDNILWAGPNKGQDPNFSYSDTWTP